MHPLLADFFQRLTDAAKPLGVWPPLRDHDREPLALRFGRVLDELLSARPGVSANDVRAALDSYGESLDVPRRVWQQEADEAMYRALSMGDSIRLGGL